MIGILLSAVWLFLIPQSAKASLPPQTLTTENYLTVDVRNLTRNDLLAEMNIPSNKGLPFTRRFALGEASDAEVAKELIVAKIAKPYETTVISRPQECNKGGCLPLQGIRQGRRPF